MTFAIITHVLHKRTHTGAVGAYAPYVNEMNMWLKHVDAVVVVAPLENAESEAIDMMYNHHRLRLLRVPALDFTRFWRAVASLAVLPFVCFQIMRGMAMADHIHLRCPGNMGLLGCVCQVFFPKKPKSAKYAGNWDWNSKQPVTYRWQQKLLSNEKWTRNMSVLVYGEWGDLSRNICPLFTATYSETEALSILPRSLHASPICFLFVGKLATGKRPLESVKTVEKLLEQGIEAALFILGDGDERSTINEYIAEKKLAGHITCLGNVSREEAKQWYQKAHFLLFASKSEGWPKAVAEAMWWACVPITTAVSCVPQILGNGERGSLVAPNATSMAAAVLHYLNHQDEYEKVAYQAMAWARGYTLERFESEICKILSNA